MAPTNETSHLLPPPVMPIARSAFRLRVTFAVAPDMSYDDLSRPSSIPFMHTRHGSNVSLSDRDSRINLPSRRYQIEPGTSSRSSVASTDLKRQSVPVPPKPPLHGRGSYTEIPLGETETRPAGRNRVIPLVQALAPFLRIVPPRSLARRLRSHVPPSSPRHGMRPNP